jgi:site-specific DNA-methyltransferase (adenine-specific)
MELYHGDCLEEMKQIPDGSVDMVMTDPPYGTTACKWDTVLDLELMWDDLKRVIKPNGAIVMTASQPFTTTLIASNMKMFKYCWVWDKKAVSNPQLAKIQPLKCHEDIIVFARGKTLYNPQGLVDFAGKSHQGKASNLGHIKRNLTEYKQEKTGYPKSIQYFKQQRGFHPTQKPVALMEYLIKTYTNEGETVLDFTMGSGTTGVACKNLNRDFIGIEQDDKYFEIAKKRIEDAKGLF